MIILDTNVVSEVVRPAPAPEVLRWFAVQPASGVFITTITQAEILYGLEVMPKGKRRTNLQFAIETIFGEDFADRVLPSIAMRLAPSHRSPLRAGRWAAP